jgi:serine protease Do
MWKSWKSWVCLAAAVAVVTGIVLAPASRCSQADENRPYIKIVSYAGNGSGVHIGSGFFLTAAHVVQNMKDVTVRAEDGSTAVAEVLWANTAYDIALLHGDGLRIDTAPLSCAPSADGNQVTAYGNPMDLEFLSSEGRIVGKAGPIGHWRLAIAADLTIVPGMSGGAVVSEAGDIVGITVGTMVVPVPAGDISTASIVGFGVVVPSSAVCDLLARA